MIFDLDLEDDLPPWDLSVMCEGTLIKVSKPTGEQIARMTDLKDFTREAAHRGFCQLLAELTMIRFEVLATRLDAEVIDTFFTALLGHMVKRMQYRGQLRTQQRLTHPPQAAGASPLVN